MNHFPAFSSFNPSILDAKEKSAKSIVSLLHSNIDLTIQILYETFNFVI